jgi:hypothetical protein
LTRFSHVCTPRWDSGDWFTNTFANVEYTPMEMTDAEKAMYQMTMTEYIAAFKAGTITATAYATALVKRMMHYEILKCRRAPALTYRPQAKLPPRPHRTCRRDLSPPP